MTLYTTCGARISGVLIERHRSARCDGRDGRSRQSFERLNKSRMRRDWLLECSRLQLLLAWAALILGTVLIAHIGTPHLFDLFDFIARTLQ